MADRRTYGSYNDGCAAAHALDLVGDRWTMIVVRELLLGPKRFGELQRDVCGIGPTVLARRLRGLVADGLAERRAGDGDARSEVYELTPWGLGLERVNAALAEWAVASPTLPWGADMSPDTLVLTMRAHARPCPDLNTPVAVALRLTDSRHDPTGDPVGYVARLGRDGSTLVRDPDPGDTAAVITATTRALKALVLGTEAPAGHPEATVTGDHAAFERLLAATRLTPPA